MRVTQLADLVESGADSAVWNAVAAIIAGNWTAKYTGTHTTHADE